MPTIYSFGDTNYSKREHFSYQIRQKHKYCDKIKSTISLRVSFESSKIKLAIMQVFLLKFFFWDRKVNHVTDDFNQTQFPFKLIRISIKSQQHNSITKVLTQHLIMFVVCNLKFIFICSNIDSFYYNTNLYSRQIRAYVFEII